MELWVHVFRAKTAAPPLYAKQIKANTPHLTPHPNSARPLNLPVFDLCSEIILLRRKMERSFEPQGLWIPSLKLWWVHMVFMCSNWSTWQGWVLNQNVRTPPKFSELQLGNFSCCFRPAHSKFCCDLIQIFLNSFHQLHLQWKTVMQIFRNWSFSSMISSSQKLKTTSDVDTICQSAYHAM